VKTRGRALRSAMGDVGGKRNRHPSLKLRSGRRRRGGRRGTQSAGEVDLRRAICDPTPTRRRVCENTGPGFAIGDLRFGNSATWSPPQPVGVFVKTRGPALCSATGGSAICASERDTPRYHWSPFSGNWSSGLSTPRPFAPVATCK
jgi:hypothetical protein